MGTPAQAPLADTGAAFLPPRLFISNIRNFKNSITPPKRPLFSLGQILSTPGALDALTDAGTAAGALLSRHVTGDWGTLCAEDAQENALAVQECFRILSSYKLPTGVKVWIITEADRSVTTLLLPLEY